MKYIPLILLVVILSLSSCTNLVRIVSIKPGTPSVDSATLTFENDTLSIKYNFYGEGSYLNLMIYNKLNVPIYIDWGSSLYVTGTTKHDYTNTEFYGPRWRTTYSSTYELVPPKTSTTKTQYLQIPVNLAIIPMVRKIKVKSPNKYNPDNRDSFKASQTDFFRNTSPFDFRSYLTISVGSKTGTEIHFDHEFWISNIKEMTKDQFLGTEIDPSSGNEVYSNPFRDIHCFYFIYNPNQYQTQ